MEILKNLYQYRELLKTNVKKEIRGKYKGSFLGILWSFLNPLLMVLVYAIVFPYIMRIKTDNYLIYLITGVIPWNFFVTCITTGCNCVWTNGGIIKKVYFPREILPISVIAAGLINFFISCIIIILFVIFGNVPLTFNILWLPVIAIIQCALSLGLLFILSAINVYVRDVEYIVTFFLNLIFYLTPILYTTEMFPSKYSWVINLNPMTHIINSYRNIFYYGVHPEFKALCVVAVVSLIVMFVGLAIFKKLEKGFAEEV